MYYTIYKTTNLINGKYYIGKHQTENIYDNYYGSGVALEKSIKKYGKENFKKEILFIFDNEKEMNQKERELVNESFVNDRNNYNLGLGGEGGPMFLGKHHSDETRKKLQKLAKNRTLSEETKKKISNSNKNRTFSEETKKKISEKLSKLHKTDVWKNKVSKSLKAYYDKIGRKNKIRNPKREIMCNIDNVTGKRMYIHKEDLCYRIYIEELNYYLDKGWIIGRNEQFKNNVSKSLKGKGSGKSNSVYGMKWMYNDELKETKMIKPEYVEEYLNNGWKFGNKNKVYKNKYNN